MTENRATLVRIPNHFFVGKGPCVYVYMKRVQWAHLGDRSQVKRAKTTYLWPVSGHRAQVKGHHVVTDYYSRLREQGTRNKTINTLTQHNITINGKHNIIHIITHNTFEHNIQYNKYYFRSYLAAQP